MSASLRDRHALEKWFPHVSHETWKRLDLYVQLVQQWQPKINLVSPSTLPVIWTRHIADSLQLAEHVSADAHDVWVDVGSGGGFPALVLAAAFADVPGFVIHLVESDQRKCVFLREAVRIMQVPAQVHVGRSEVVLGKGGLNARVVTARALAALPKLIELTFPLLTKGAIGLFPKGKDASQELTEALKYWNMDCLLKPSVTDPDAQIVIVRNVSPRGAQNQV